MKATREELIDFFKWNERECFGYEVDRITAENQVDFYLKSINSKAGNETPTVTDSEAKKEVCQYCHGTKEVEFMDSYGRIIGRKRCPYC